MDTHAHHLHKAPGQKIWHYFFEFLMLFLAVFCGFLAEYRLEHRIESDKEKEFISSAVKEMKTDLLEIKNFEVDSNRYRCLDTLARLLLGPDRSQLAIRKMYKLSWNIYPNWYVLFKKSTLTQLKSAGNMRLIRNNAVADSLIGWDGSITNASYTWDSHVKMANDNIRLANRIFDKSCYMKNGKWIDEREFFNMNNSFKLLTYDNNLLHELGNNLSDQTQILNYYDGCIYSHKLYTTRLIDFFIKEYHLKNLNN